MNTFTPSMNEAIGEGVKQQAGGGGGEYMRPSCFGKMSPWGLGTLVFTSFTNKKLCKVVGRNKKYIYNNNNNNKFLVFHIPWVQRFPIIGVHCFALSKERAKLSPNTTKSHIYIYIWKATFYNLHSKNFARVVKHFVKKWPRL
jgi:hypothetical protein